MKDGRRVAQAALATLAAVTMLLLAPALASAAPAITLASPAEGSYTNDSTPSFAGATDDTLDPVTLTIHEGNAAGPIVETPLALLSAVSETWEASAETSLPDGQYTAVAEQTNGLLEIGSASVTFTVDTKAPLVTLGSMPVWTKDSTPTLAGTAGTTVGDETSVLVTLYKGSVVGGTVVESLSTPVTAAKWSYTAAALPDGTYTAQAVQEDAAGNVGKSSAVTFIVDTTAPIVSINSATSPSKNATPELTGAAGVQAGDRSSVVVTVYSGSSTAGSVVQTKTLAPSGSSWSYLLSKLADGTYTAQAVQEDEAGNVGKSSAVTFTIDTTAPVLAIVEAPAAHTKSSTPALAGTAGTAAGDQTTVLLTLYKGSVVGGTVVEAASRPVSAAKWSYTAAVLPDGTYTAQAVQEDAAGNVGKSSAVTFTVDTTAPIVSLNSLTSPSKNTMPELTGTAGVLAGDRASIMVTVYSGSSTAGSVVQTKTVTPGGSSWSYLVSKLADGTYTAQAVQEDEAGNVGKSSAVTFIVDTTAPIVSINSATSPSKNATPELTGTAGVQAGDKSSVAVTVYSGSSTAGSVVQTKAVSPSGSSWSYLVSKLADGTYTAQAVQEDAAGNVGKSSAVTFTVDTAAPVISINSVPSPGKNQTPDLTGTAGVQTGDKASVLVTVYAGSSTAGTEVQTKTVVPSGSSWSYPASKLADGTYTAQAVQEDAAGNVGKSAAVTFTIETDAPTVSIEPVVSPSRDTTPTLTGSAGTKPTDEGATLRIYAGKSVAGVALEELPIVIEISGHWSHKTLPLPDGEYTARITQEDAAKNLGEDTITFAIDTKPPLLTLTSPANDAVVESARPTFGGTAGTAKGDHGSVGLKIYAGTSSAGTPVQTVSVATDESSWTTGSGGPSLANGIYTVVAEQTDTAGNASTSTATFAVGVPAPPPPSPPSPPTAAFQWFPATPHVGEQVSLVSTSTDADSTITGFSWSLAANLPFGPGEHVLTTSFASPGTRVVRLHVTDANGLTSEVAEPLSVAARPLTLMQPFPVVRIAGSASSSSIRITLFTVQAPAGATVSVACHGHGCPRKSQSLVLASKAKNREGTVLISFGRFERSLRAGAVLEIRVSKPGQIGKYTRFTVRRGKLPARTDSCLGPTGSKPMRCPS